MNTLGEHLPKRLVARLRNDIVYSRVAKGVFWSLLGSTLAQGLTLLSSIPVARLLGSEGFGELGIIQNTIGTFVIFAGPALVVAATKHIAQLRSSDPERAGRIIGMTSITGVLASALVAGILYIAAPLLASAALSAPHLGNALRVASLVLFFNGIIGVQNGILAGFEAFRSIAQVNLWRGLITFPALVAAAWLWRLPGVLLALLMVSVITVGANQRMIHKETAESGAFARYDNIRSEWRILYTFAFPTLLGSIMVMSANWLTSAMLVNQPNGYIEMGIFNAANQWRTAVLFFPSILSKPVLPMLSESLNRSLDEYRQLLKLNLVLTAAVSLLLALGVVVASRWIMSAYGDDFTGSGRVLALLAVSAVFSASAGVVGTAIWSIGKMWFSFGLNTAWAIVFVGTFLVTARWGALGLSVAYALSYMFHMILTGLYVRFPMRAQLSERELA